MIAKLFLMLGPSGVGKSTILREVKAKHPEFFFPVSVTTRAPRVGEVDGLQYHFVRSEEFDTYLREDRLLEWAVVHQTDRYGVLKDNVVEALDAGTSVFREVNVEGCAKIRATDLRSRVVTVFIMPPSLEILQARIKARSPISEAELAARMQDVAEEMEYGKTCDYRITSVEGQPELVYRAVEAAIRQELA